MDLSRFRTLARNWEAFGRRDPLFGVLSDPTRQHGRWQVDEFFESGRAHVAKLFRILDERGVSVASGRALDFGCGVGRLTVPIAARFDETVGVDVAKSMVALARRHNAAGSRCTFVVNRNPDLRQFADASFDFVHTCLVLQHIPPEVSTRYIGEFLRIAKPGGIAVFQIPAEVLTDQQIDARHRLPDAGYRARISMGERSLQADAGSRLAVDLTLTNESPVTWLLDIPGGRHFCVANHWLDASGAVVIPDDGRARLPHDLGPGQSGKVRLEVQAPLREGEYVLELDVVQERICWFAQKGSPTARIPVSVRAKRADEDAPHAQAAAPAAPREGFFARFRRRLQPPAPYFEMHVVPRANVERVVTAAGGTVLHAIDDGAAGAGWLSYTYVCEKLRDK